MHQSGPSEQPSAPLTSDNEVIGLLAENTFTIIGTLNDMSHSGVKEKILNFLDDLGLKAAHVIEITGEFNPELFGGSTSQFPEVNGQQQGLQKEVSQMRLLNHDCGLTARTISDSIEGVPSERSRSVELTVKKVVHLIQPPIHGNPQTKVVRVVSRGSHDSN